MHRFASYVCICFAITTLFASHSRAGETITVAAAISLQKAADEIGKDYEKQTGDKVEFIYGASGQLMTQIKAGAPIDLFISAGASQVDELTKAGKLDASSRRTIARNRIVLIIPSNADVKIWSRQFDALTDPSIKRIAIGDPKTVPAGTYAMQTLTHFNLFDALQPRLIYGANVRQVLTYVERGEVAAGFVYATDAADSSDRVKVVLVASDASHEPIEYPAATVAGSSKASAAKRFLEYLGGDAAQARLKQRGFVLPNDPPTTTRSDRP